MKVLIYVLIRCYQWVISPVLHTICGPSSGCRFTPSCSQYFLEAVRLHGACRGSVLGVKRICRCHPRGGFGDDPVPPRHAEPASAGGEHNSAAPGKNSGGHCERSALYHSPPNPPDLPAATKPFLNNRHHG